MAFDFDHLNLNLVIALRELLHSRSVTVAAKRLGVTQSAMSHRLDQLREAFDDPLLVRSGRGMLLTPRAERLAARVGPALEALGRALADDPGFDPASSNRRFRVTSGDYLATTFLPRLLGVLREEAPNVDLDIDTLARGIDDEHYYADLERGEIDLLAGASQSDRAGLQRQLLHWEGFACLVRADHPEVGKRLTLARYTRLGHALITTSGKGPSIVDARLEALGQGRRIVLRIGSFLAAPVVVASSDLVLTAPAGLAVHLAERYPLRVLRPPIELPDYPILSMWHERIKEEPGHAWLRGAVARAARAYHEEFKATARDRGLAWSIRDSR